MRQANQSVCPMQWNDNKNNGQKPISKVCVTTSLTIEDLLHNMGCFDISEKWEYLVFLRSFEFKLYNSSRTAMSMLSERCRPGDAETTFHKCVSFIPEGKDNICLMLSAVTIFQIKPPIYFSHSLKCAGE